ncbi:MAG TPA: type II secretion system protein E [Candidatus Methanoculleus thermohydrogenotrophicum]|jgi:metal-responsive CopG/Arc/MetJ family transcriptional regulator|nr:type II secretion system protein E [Candidatus Methanoculleus thermohydrogenotrophicum]NLM81558.1 type II secretion system protein E [Candidatus Methanoculleus thermohydrogenotrophicum]HOB18447.1 type II secretion system protein E [Candidatus Methanoculleus thermohydrogenotrophicum]HPZ38507.1 type II secretion system protein E [Candidatus Methanoculleus thermohydrogenotrophicum]HQC91658.1 type II secretion system protein E [Candidatus Methanoculleus thermohydrogenotrophicum]
MVMRCSFALDPGLLEQIDQFARDHAFDRNEAILELIEAGLVCQKDGKMPPPVRQQHSSEELNVLQRELEDIKEILIELRNEVRLVHHTIETDWNKEAKGVPFQTKHPWEFWRK